MARNPDPSPVEAAPPAQPQPLPGGLDDQPRVMLHMPVDVRSVSLGVIAVLACIFVLHWARVVVVPVLLGVMFSYALTPAVDFLVRCRVPRAIGSAAVVSTILGLIGWGAWSMADDASALVDTLPQVAQKVRKAIEGQYKKPTPSKIEAMQQAAAELERAAREPSPGASVVPAAGSAVPGASAPRGPASAPASGPLTTQVPRNVTRVVVEKPVVDVRDYLWSGTLGLAAFLGQAAVAIFVTLFLLAAGDTFRRKMVKLAGPRLSQKRITIQALDEVSEQIQRYLFVQAATSIVVGVATGLAFFFLGLNHAAVWAVAAGITNLIPYVGAAIVGAGSTIVAFMQFDSIDQALLVGGASFGIHALVGNLLTPWWTGRASRMSPFVVFVGIVFFGWLWGAVGLILGTPILMVAKAVADRVDELKPIGEFLGA